VHLLNDLVSIAHSVSVLQPGEMHVLQEGEPNLAGNARSWPPAPAWASRSSSTMDAISCRRRRKAVMRTSRRAPSASGSSCSG
jgi:hypothetical protein